MKPIRNLLSGLLIISGFVAALNFLHAQDTTTSGQDQSIADTNVDWNSLSDFDVELKAVEAMPTISAAELAASGLQGTFYSAQHIRDWPPVPGDWLSLPIWEVDTNLFLINDLAENYTALQAKSSATMSGVHALDDGGGFSPDFNIADYGTNLWIAQVGLLSGNLAGVVSNTSAEISYEIQSKENLSQTNWNSEGFISGSDITNWTPISVAQNGRTNLFLRIRSWADDGSGLPIWWQLQYFGYVGVDPNALDSAGDGWAIFQKFQMGLNPNVFYTPPTPQGLTITYNVTNGTATVSWLPNPGAVTSYTVSMNGTDYTVPAADDSLTESVSDDPYDIVDGGPSAYIYSTVQANYSGGSSPQASTSLEPNYPNNVVVVSGSQGFSYLIAAPTSLPVGTTAIRLTRVDTYAEYYYGSSAYDTNWDIPLSAITNGVYLIPAYMEAAPVDGYGQGYYEWWVQTVANGVANSLAGGAGFGNPFYDGRVQLKQNLIFLLRAASENNSFQFTEYNTNYFFPADSGGGYYSSAFANPINYAWVSPYQGTGGTDGYGYEYFGYYVDEPFDDNERYLNFVFNTANLTGGGGNFSGYLTTGAGVYDGQFELFDPTYQFESPTTNSYLATNQTRWLYSEWDAAPDNSITYLTYPTFSMASNAKNLFGLPYLSAELAYPTASGLGTTTLSAGGNVTISSTAPSYCQIYPEIAQPEFQTVEYDFWNPAPSGDPIAQTPAMDLVPGMPGFSTTNKSRLFIFASGAQPLDYFQYGYSVEQLVSYAKLAVTNGYSGTYAYLGQYFDQAYEINTNGIVTTNSAGILSPDGFYYPTNPSPAVLTTMSDPDTGIQGTCTVYNIKLQLDVNHDGTMDTSFGGPDNTSPNQPFIFWCNNNFDRWKYDLLGQTNEQDDVLSGSNPGTYTPEPDCNYTNAAGDRAIPCARDLEDFARLWVCGITSNLLAALPSGSTITLNWGDVGNPNSANPTIDLFAAADADGGTGYLTNEAIADEQTNLSDCPFIGRIAPGGSVQLNTIQFSNYWAGNYFIWCGVSNGTGGLNLTIADANGNVIGQATAYIQIVDIKQMYERWTVGDNPNVAPTSVPSLATENLPVGVSAFQYALPQSTNTPYILFVHGWNMEPWEKDRFAETTFKRLYWQGYQGRFGSFRWPTYADFPLGSWSWSSFDLRNYDDSESNAWASAAGLLNMLTSLNAEYPSQVYLIAHSMGNVVAGEALRLATNQVVNTYVALQGAIAAHAYDTNTPIRDEDASTPDNYANYWTNGAPCYFNSSIGARTNINFFNPGDWALTQLWPFDQDTKPDHSMMDYPGYYYTVSSLHPNGFYVQFGSGTNDFRNLNFPDDTYTIFAYCDEASSYALGAQENVGGIFSSNQVELDNPPYFFGQNHIDHSGEFRSDYGQRAPFWNTVLVKMNLKQ